MNVSFWLVLWAIAVVLTVVASRRRDGSGRPWLPVTFVWLAAFGLALTLFGGYVPGWAWLAWLAALVVAILARFKVAATVVAAAAGLALVGVMIGVLTPRSSVAVAAAPRPSATAAPKPTPTPSATTTPASCNPQFAQKWDANQGNRFASGGLWDNPTTKAVSVNGAATRQKTLASRDARYLAGAAWSVQLWDDPNRVAPLLTANKGCLSPEGVTLYDKLVAKWNSGQAAIGQAPATGVNTGSRRGTFVVSATNGVSGDRTAIVRTYPNGSRSYDLIRCGNFVLPQRPAKVPVGRTDQTPPPRVPPTTPPPTTPPPTTPPPTTPPPTTPPPTTPPPTTPPPTTPPPTTPPTLTPKDPADSLPGPSGKPLAPAPAQPVETAPPVEPSPADPATKPAAPAPPVVPAPEATPAPAQTTPPPAPLETVAPPPSDPGTSIPDPDGPPAAGFALPLLGLGALVRRKLGQGR